MRKDKHRRALVGFVKRKKEKQTWKKRNIRKVRYLVKHVSVEKEVVKRFIQYSKKKDRMKNGKKKVTYTTM